jgi:hypothetical protein
MAISPLQSVIDRHPIVSYVGTPYSAPQSTGQYVLYKPAGDDGESRAIFMDSGTGQLYTTVRGEDEVGYKALGDEETAFYASGFVDPNFNFADYNSALQAYSSGYQPWDIQNVYSGLSSREPFNLNALWGGTQYAIGRVTDYANIDPTQYEANLIASNTRNALWNQYDQLVASGATPPKNPDQIALDFYVQTVGAQGSTYGYGPGANTVLVTEAIKNKFLNQPEVIQATGSRYTTPEAQLLAATEFGAAHEAGVPVWQEFEQQGYSKDLLGSLMPMILGAMIFPGLSGALANALGGGIAGNIAAASIIGGVNAEIQGGDFLDGAIKAALTAGAGAAMSSVGVAAEVSSALQSLDIAPDVANFVAKTVENAATSAVVAEATGGDAASAVANALLSAGVSVVRSEVVDIVNNVTATEAPADIEDAALGAAMTEAALPQETGIVAPQQTDAGIVSETPISPVSEVSPEIAPVDIQDILAEIQQPAVTPAVEEPIVPRETTQVSSEVAAEPLPEPVAEELLPDLTEELPEEQPIPEATPEVEPEPVLPPAEEQPAEEPAPEEAPAEEDVFGSVEDEDIMQAIEEEAPVEEAPAEETPAEEALVEDEAPATEVGAEEPAPEVTQEELPAETPAQFEGPSDIDRLIASLLLSESGGRTTQPRRPTAQGSVSPREISGSVTGIIGKKQPIFGSDEDEQSAEWNRRSLRLRKILGL